MQQQINQFISLLQAGGDHERAPTGAILDIGIEVLARNQDFDDVEVAIGAGPVNWKALIIVTTCGESRIGLRGQ